MNQIKHKQSPRTRLMIAASALAFGLQLVCFAQSDQPKDGRYFEAQARQSYAAKDYPAFLFNISRATELRPNHPRLLYNLAVAYTLNNKSDEALATLERLTAMGLVLPAAKEVIFSPLRDSARFKTIVAAFERNKAPVGESTEAFAVDEKGLITEGLAYDADTGDYFISSVHKRKIIRVDRSGHASDFATAEQGLWSVLGMRVDAKRRCLWVASAVMSQMLAFRPAENGGSGILKFDLATGKLIKKYVLENREPKHVLGDLVLSSNGDLFTTDSLSAAIYVIHRDSDRLELWLTDSRFSSPQGLAFSADEKWLFMADYGSGMFAIETGTKNLYAITAPANVTLLGIDGLYFYQGDLVAVQNGVNPQRVVRIRLSRDQRNAAEFKVLCANNPVFDEPTLGVIVGQEFLFVANSQWGKISDEGKLAPEEQLRGPVILKLKL
jgi:sugar lactone lactonase YvrE